MWKKANERQISVATSDDFDSSIVFPLQFGAQTTQAPSIGSESFNWARETERERNKGLF